VAYHWGQACAGHELAEVECALKAIGAWAAAADAAYCSSSLHEALRLYQKAASIAEQLADVLGIDPEAAQVVGGCVVCVGGC
jgi:hypothetical protein